MTKQGRKITTTKIFDLRRSRDSRTLFALMPSDGNILEHASEIGIFEKVRLEGAKFESQGVAERDDRRLRRALRCRGSRSQCREEEEERNDTRRETSVVGISVSRGSRVYASSRWKLAAACSLLSLSLSLTGSQQPIARRKNKQVCCVLISGRGGGREG